MIVRKWAAGAALAVAAGGGVVAGSVLLGSANAATTPTATTPAGPGVQENDGIPEAQEHHGGHGVDLSGTVTAVGSDSVTIQPSTGSAVTYKVVSASDIDKNGEAQLSSLVAGDAVRYSVTPGTTTIDKLHAGDEAKDFPGGTSEAPGA